MNEQEQQIAIAEFCGWTRHVVQNADSDGPILDGKTMIRWTAPGEVLNRNPYWNRREPLDYLNDLNAIHEAVSKLSPLHKRIFGDVLNEILEVFENDYYEGMVPGFDISCFSEAIAKISQATAKQKSEALLRTLGIWKD